jgi:hypothetical protein
MPAPAAVTTATPVGKLPKASRYALISKSIHHPTLHFTLG